MEFAYPNFDKILNESTIIETSEEACKHSVLDEIEKSHQSYQERVARNKLKIPKILPLYHETKRKRDIAAKYPVYKLQCHYQKLKKVETECNHTGSLIIDRSVLTSDEHIYYLSRPKKHVHPPRKQPYCFYHKIFLPNCTTRIDKLAIPKAEKIQGTWQEFHHILSIKHLEALKKYLLKPYTNHTSIENALTFMKEEDRLSKISEKVAIKKCRAIKKRIRDIKKNAIIRIVYAVFEDMRDFLTSDKLIEDPEVKHMRDVIFHNICKFGERQKNPSAGIVYIENVIANNLAVWIHEFAKNCNLEYEGRRDVGEDQDNIPVAALRDKLLPVQDYIPDVSTDFFGEEEEGELSCLDFEDECCDVASENVCTHFSGTHDSDYFLSEQVE